MRTLILTFLILFSGISIAAVPDDIAPVAGRYAGLAYNGNDMDPVVTVLAFNDQGIFAGSYVVQDETGDFQGTLTNIIKEGPYSFSMEWTDHDGEGFVMFEFNQDFSSFDGFWTDQDGQIRRPWNGRRQ